MLVYIAQEKAKIANLLKLERFHRDTAQWENCRAAYHPDDTKTYINVAWYEGQIDDFLRKSSRVHQGKTNILHSSFDPVGIQINGRFAISEAFCLVTSSITINNIDYELSSHMRLATRLEKMPDTGEWVMLSLESIYVRDRLATTFPSALPTQPLVMSDEVKAFPKAYRSLAFVMSKRGLKPRPGLPHEEDQESVRQILEGNAEFLRNAGSV